jgi:hypothetical protein
VLKKEKETHAFQSEKKADQLVHPELKRDKFSQSSSHQKKHMYPPEEQE